MSNRIGKLAVRYAFIYLRRRYRRPIRLGIGVAAVGLGIAAYWATREVPEG
ncbi:MAG TPA: hypothetical protein VGF09_03020 [Solirubrobacterales bacterium]|jgi:hypothetical protein